MEWFTKAVLVIVIAFGCGASVGCDDQQPLSAASPVSGMKPSQLPDNVKILQEPERQTVLDSTRRSDLPQPGGELRIGGRRFWSFPYVSAARIVFEPDAELIFTCDAIMVRKTMFVIAEEITSLDQQRPGRIVWECPGRAEPSELGTAGAGADMAAGEEGATGGAGENGKQGTTGLLGRDAPQITIVALKVQNPLLVDLMGQDGGPGGKGQAGGRGGGGGRGNPASQGGFGCNRGAGNGAPGGAGGSGGVGGVGGGGGRGGDLTLIVPDDIAPIATRLLKVKLSGGNGGSGGRGGDPGQGGSGGPGGQEAKPWCSGNGGQGPTGAPGAPGNSGETGARGVDGDFYIGSLKADEFRRLTRNQS